MSKASITRMWIAGLIVLVAGLAMGVSALANARQWRHVGSSGNWERR